MKHGLIAAAKTAAKRQPRPLRSWDTPMSESSGVSAPGPTKRSKKIPVCNYRQAGIFDGLERNNLRFQAGICSTVTI